MSELIVNFFRRHLAYFALLVIYYLVLYGDDYIYNPFEASNNHNYILLLFLVCLIYRLYQKDANIAVTWIDILSVTFLILLFLSRLNTSVLFNDVLKNVCYLSLVYIIIRLNIRRTEAILVLFGGIFLTFFFEITTFIKQLYISLSIPASSSLFSKGTFANSGLLAGYMVAITPLGVLLIKRIDQKYLRHALDIALFGSLAFIVAITRSRSAIVCLCVIPVGILRFYPQTSALLKRALHGKWRIAGTVSLIAFVITFSYFLFNIKQSSAIGRFLIWKITMQNYLESPLSSIGYGEFRNIYPHWQANYFKKNTTFTDLHLLADTPNTAFSEPLQILVETGLTGFICFLLLVGVTFAQKTPEECTEISYALKSVVLLIVTFSISSYPFNSTPLLLLFFISLSLQSNISQKHFTFIMPIPAQRFILASVIVAGIWLLKFNYSRKDVIALWSKAKIQVQTENRIALSLFEKIYPDLKENALFLSDFGIALYHFNEFEKSINILEKSKRLRLKYETLLYLGQAYQSKGNFNAAKREFLFASFMLPNRLKPKYLIAKTLLEQGDTLQAKSAARDLLRIPVKVPSNEVDAMRNEMLSLLR